MIKIVKLQKTCPYCPSQWDAWTDEGYPIYIKYRWGHLQVRKGLFGKSVANAIFGYSIVDKQVGEPMDGYMEFKELKEATKDKIIFDCKEELYENK